MELYDFLLDMGSFPQRELPADDLRSTRNENSGLPGARRYLGQAAAFRLAWDGDPALLDGFTQERDGLLTVPAEKRKPCLAHLMTQAAQGNAAAQEVFRRVGRNIGQINRCALSVRAVRQGAGVLPTAAGGLPGDRPGAGAGGGGRGTERHAADAGAGSKGCHRGAVRTGDRRHVLRRHGAIKKSPLWG